MAEGQRRQKATLTGGASTLETGEEYNREFQTEEQKVILWHSDNCNLRPASSKPAFRLIGLFANVDDARAHGQRILRADPGCPCAMRIGATHAWYSIPSEMFTDITPHLEKVNRNLQLHQEVLKESTDEFIRHKAELTAGRKPVSPSHIRDALNGSETNVGDGSDADGDVGANDDGGVSESKSSGGSSSDSNSGETSTGTAIANDDGGVSESKSSSSEEPVSEYSPSRLMRLLMASKEQQQEPDQEWVSTEIAGGNHIAVPPLCREAEVRNQKYAVVSVMVDYEAIQNDTPLEPSVCVWGAFDSEAEAILYSKCIVAKQLKDHDIAVITMYEWCYPPLLSSDKIQQLYRNEELNHIMKHARTSRTSVAAFERECTENQLEIPCMEIEPDLENPAPRLFSTTSDTVFTPF